MYTQENVTANVASHEEMINQAVKVSKPMKIVSKNPRKHVPLFPSSNRPMDTTIHPFLHCWCLDFLHWRKAEKIIQGKSGNNVKLDLFFMTFPDDYMTSVFIPLTNDNLTKSLIL